MVIQVAVSVFFDLGGHAVFINLPSTVLLELALTPSRGLGTLTFSGDFPFVGVTGEWADDGSFTGTGKGTVAGFPKVKVEFRGTVTDEGISGEYEMGVNGKLPGGKSITYLFEGSWPDGLLA